MLKNGKVKQDPEPEQQQLQQLKPDNVSFLESDNAFKLSNILYVSLKYFLLLMWNFTTSFFSLFFIKKKSIRNETVLITGSGGYLGRQLAIEFSKQNVTLILWDINDEANKETYNALCAIGHRRMFLYKVDLSNESDVRENAKKVKEQHGFVSLILLGAAIPGAIESVFSLTDNEKLNKSFRIFYQSHLWIYQEFVPQMIEKNHGHIAIISSEVVFTTLAFIAVYSSFKTAQLKLLEALDAELNHHEFNKVKTTVIYLGGLKQGISTSMVSKFGSGQKYLQNYGLSSQYAAKRVVTSILENRKSIYLPLYVYLIVLVKYLLPTSCSELLLTSKNFIKSDKLLSTYKQTITTATATKLFQQGLTKAQTIKKI